MFLKLFHSLHPLYSFCAGSPPPPFGFPLRPNKAIRLTRIASTILTPGLTQITTQKFKLSLKSSILCVD